MERFRAFAEFMRAGGPVNWVIAGLYVLTLAVFSERFIYFFRTRYNRAQIFRMIESGVSPFSDFCAASCAASSNDSRVAKRGPLMRMVLVFFKRREEPGPVLSEILDREAALIRAEMERGQTILSFIGTTAPLLGLLGTITGLINAFSQIEKQGSSVDISFLSGGIWEAMITTATGLITAICALSCGKWFEHLSASRLRDMTFAVSILSEQFRRDILDGAAVSSGEDAGEVAPEDGKQDKESA
ncbi:MAG: MotA/TolQ/ExbB proton channel family protein [Spirochaetaceae bacterium]|jgi:biopolymer transport protein ExbB|nr:MotA/TolQ/ExbB proton channel family protein [Spirochaetaceae bacterium]